MSRRSIPVVQKLGDLTCINRTGHPITQEELSAALINALSAIADRNAKRRDENTGSARKGESGGAKQSPK